MSEPQVDVLGRLLVVPDAIQVLPTEASIAAFLCGALGEAPGIGKVHVCIRDMVYPPDAALEDLCRRFVAAADAPTSIRPDELEAIAGTELIPLATIRRLYGFLALDLVDAAAFAPYRSFFRNIAGSVAATLEGRASLAEITRARSELEARVAARTTELRDQNAQLKAKVAEHAKAEEAIRQASLEIEDLYNNAPCGYQSVDKDGLIVRINDTELAWLGYAREEVVGKKRTLDLLSPATKGAYRQAFSRLKTRGGVMSEELEMIRKDGTSFPVELVATAVTNRDGNFVMSRSAVRDVSERARAEEALRQSEEAYRGLFELSPDAIVAWGPDGVFDAANQATATLLALDAPEEVIGRRWLDFVVPEDRAARAETLREVEKTGGVNESEFRLQRKDGSRVFVQARARTALDSAGNPAKTISMVRDVTGRRRMEEALRKREASLKLQFERMPIAYITWDPEFRTTSWNPAAEKIFGFSTSEAIGKHPYDFIVPKEAQPQVDAIWSRLLEGDATARSVNENTTKDGRVILCDWTNTPLIEDDGRVVGVLSMVQDITERKQAEDALRKSEADLREAARYTRSLIEASLDPLVTISPDGKVTDVNEATVRATGIAREALIGGDFSTYFTEPANARAGYLEVYAKGFVTDYPLALRHVSGGVTDVLYNATLYRDEKGDVAGVFAAARDVTEHNRVEERNRQLAAIVESSDDAIFRKTLDGVITSWNKGAEKIYGYAPEEVVGKPVSILMPPEREAEMARNLAEIRAGRHITHFETVRLRKDGRQIDLSLTLSPVRDPSGQIVGVSAIERDVTERKRVEKEREQYLRFFSLSTENMAIADPFGCFKQVNPAFSALTGYTAGELISKPFMDFIVPEDRRRTADELALQVSTRPTMNFENRYVRKDGGIIDLSWNAYFDKTDGVTYAVARDVTERKRAEEELDGYRRHLEELVSLRTAELTKTNLELEAVNRELETFSYSVSHDLRTPLRAIDGFSRILLEDYADKLDAEGQRQLNVVRDNTVKMGRLIDDVLAFSRSGRGEMSLAPIDMDRSVRGVIAEMAPVLAGRKVTFDVKPLAAAQGDGAMIKRVWTNLIDNAVKFTAPKPEAVIEIGSTAGEKETVYYVKDNGAGFDMQYLGKLFGVFQRLHGAEFPGTGIGLAIVKRIVARHGGRVWAEGKVGEGASFYFALPIVEIAHD